MEIGDVYSDSNVRLYALKVTGNKPDADELISRCVELCCEKADKIKQIQSDGKFRFYFFTMMRFQHLKKQRDKREFKEINERHLSTDPRIEQVDFAARAAKVNDTLKRLHFYSAGLLELYKNDSYRGIAAKTKIPYVSVHDGIKQAKKEFKKIYNKMKIVIVIPQVDAVEYHRLIVPFTRFAEQYGSDIKIIATKKEGNQDDKWVDKITEETTHIVFNRNISWKMQPDLVISKLRKKGIKIICDIDDYWSLPKHHLLYSYYQKTNMSECIQANIQLADVVWTTTKQLRDEIKPINPNVHIVRNCLDDKEDQFIQDNRQDGFDSFIWSGGTTHKRDLGLLRGAVDDINFTIQGYHERQTYSPKYFPNAHLIGKSPLNEYAEEMKKHGVALIPLIDNKFNNMKSELKLIEAGNMSRAVICSDVFPYKQHVKHLQSGLKAKNHDWKKWIKYLNGNRNAQIDFGLALNEYVSKNYKLNEENRTRFETL